jgi:FkbH-like protein
MTNRGILLGLVSKNEESVALEAIQKHPEMVLKLDDFAGWKVNWGDKAQNVLDLVSELNLGIDSVVFIDDSPVERARVREAVPEVFVPEWPQDKMQYRRALLGLRCFDTPAVSKEDLERTRMYVSERQRRSLKERAGSLDEWYSTLETKVTVEELADVNLARAAQLLNKTNQMNLTTRRMTEAEFASWAHEEGCKLWVFRVSDKFGDAGLTGIISLEKEGRRGKITDFVLSCRVMGRKIEETMLHTLITYARSLELEEVCARYIPTAKNRPCLRFLQNSGLEDVGDNVFRWSLSRNYPKPEHIELEMR